MHVDIKKKDLLILGEWPTQGLDDTILAAGKKYSINFIENKKSSVWVFIIMEEQIVIYLLIIQKLLNSKQKILKL